MPAEQVPVKQGGTGKQKHTWTTRHDQLQLRLLFVRLVTLFHSQTVLGISHEGAETDGSKTAKAGGTIRYQSQEVRKVRR